MLGNFVDFVIIMNSVLLHLFINCIYSQAKERVCRLVQSGVESGARLLLDGRNIKVLSYPCFSESPNGSNCMLKTFGRLLHEMLSCKDFLICNGLF